MKMKVLALLLGATFLTGCDEPIGKADNGFDSKSHMSLQWPSLVEDNNIGEVELDSNPLRENYLVVFDMSGSMDEKTCAGDFPTKVAAAKNSLIRWVERVPADAALGLVVFNRDGIQTVLVPAPNNKTNFIDVLNSLATGGGTPLSTAIAEGYDELKMRARAQNGTGEYRMVVVTDGIHSSGYDPTQNIDWIIQNTPIDMFTIGFCIRESALNRPGKTHYVEADSPEKLFQGLTAALAETPTFSLTNFE